MRISLRPRMPSSLRLVGQLALLTADLQSLRLLRRLLASPPEGPAGPPIHIRVRALHGQAVSVRPGTTDAQVLFDTFGEQYHVPPSLAEGPGPRRIWDLGANIGLKVAHFAAMFPAARILGVELDEGNASLARANVAPWHDRCEILAAAVWPEDGEVAYEAQPGVEWAFRVVEGEPGSAEYRRTAPALSLDTLLAQGGEDVIDYLKMDIEGAEETVLRSHTGWATRVRCIGVEIHEPYTVEACRADPEALGFRTQVNWHHGESVVGERE